jgi:hypothetical protein
MSKRLGALVIALLACGLLFSGSAAAGRADTPIHVTVTVVSPTNANLTYVQVFAGAHVATAADPHFKQLWLYGGSDYHFSWTDQACQLDPSSGGVFCDLTKYGGAMPNLWLDAQISGTLPAAVVGKVVYDDNTIGTFTAPVAEGPPVTYGGSWGVTRNGSRIHISGSIFPPLLQFSFVGGSDWHVTSISGASASCDLTPSNGGGSCSFASPSTTFAIDLTFSGAPPTEIDGQTTFWAANTTEDWYWRFRCACAKLNTELTGFRVEKRGAKLLFFLKWRLDCAWGGDPIFCDGGISLVRPPLPHGVRLLAPDAGTWKHKLTVRCSGEAGGCSRATTGLIRLELSGRRAARANRRITLPVGLTCGAKQRTEKLVLEFDGRGNLNRKMSQLGGVGR